jgi:hypothetical protein
MINSRKGEYVQALHQAAVGYHPLFDCHHCSLAIVFGDSLLDQS